MNRLFSVGKIVVVLALMTGCNTSSESSETPTAKGASNAPAKATGVADRDYQAAANAIAKGALLVDVRSQGEFDAGHLKGSLLIPIREFESRLAEIEKANGGKTQQVILVCLSGGRAGSAKSILRRKGFTNVANAGGWKSLCGAKVAGAGANGCEVMPAK